MLLSGLSFYSLLFALFGSKGPRSSPFRSSGVHCGLNLEDSMHLHHRPWYNFHLFPRDELNIGMPSYSFSCQTSCLTSMAREGFDFNACIYDGISYLSRVQESAAKGRIQNPIPSICTMKSSSSPSVADSIFMKRIKSRVQHWRDACKDSTKTTDEALVRSLRKLILGGEFYGSRPCMNIDVSTDRQVLLVAEILSEFSDDLVPLMIPDKGGEPKAVRVVLTSSEEDRNLLKSELQHLEEEQDKQVRGFREVIDVITASCKPVVAYNCLTEFTFIHSKFIAPLPPSVEEFMCSLRMVFSNILDLNHLLKEVGPLKKAKNLPAAVSYLKRQFFIPLDMEIPHQAHQGNLGKNHNLLKITHLFAKLCSILKITPACETVASHRTAALEDYANVFYPCCSSSLDPLDGDVGAWAAAYPAKKLSTENLVFLWGFRSGISTRLLKGLLYGTHKAFSEDFEVRLVDKSSAVVVFQRPGSAESFLKDMQGSSGAVGVSALREMISEGLKAAGYEAYRRVCRLGFWEASLADSLDRALSEQQPTCALSMDYCIKDTSDIFWSNDSMIQLNDL
ncbi:poly(A)-specific ribonuclease PARN-like isoform X2 [Magnolia sinica]|uniref:poly(A)-specific ribonuclease PARN-like isoform X2 n=1 Tax=Magnolia sinica TaxID=86752 RepID=UPI00265A730C|nr:poly(A)-specific ribonuclease PARN-like isoform X2 [Magnolia sinica]